MADTLVLASLSIDASGVVSGSSQVQSSLRRAERATEQFGANTARVGKSISSFTSGLRTLTLGYLSLATAHRLVASSLNFVGLGLNKVLEEEKKYFASTSKLVGVTEQFAKAQSDLQITLGRTVASSSLYVGLMERISLTLQDMANLIPRIMPALRTAAGGGVGAAIALGGAALGAMRTTERQTENRRIIAAAQAGGARIGATRPEAITDPKRLAEIHNQAEKVLAKERQQRFDAEQKRMESFAAAVEATNRLRVVGLDIELEKMAERNKLQKEFQRDVEETLVTITEGMGDPTRGGGFTDNWKTSIEVARESWEDFVTFVMDGIEPLQLGIASIQTAIGAFVSGMSEALLKGKFSFRQFMADMLASLVPVLLGYGALGLVAGFLGNPAGFKAAGIAFAAAAAAAVAARALGGGGSAAETGGGGRGGAGAGAAAGGGGGQQTINLVVQGSLIGTDPDNLARDIAKLLRTAEADGGV